MIVRNSGRAWQVVLQTDHAPYWKYLLKAASKHFDPHPVSGAWPDAPEGRTRREIVARKKGMAIRRMTARRREAPLEIEIPRLEFNTRRPKR